MSTLLQGSASQSRVRSLQPSQFGGVTLSNPSSLQGVANFGNGQQAQRPPTYGGIQVAPPPPPLQASQIQDSNTGDGTFIYIPEQKRPSYLSTNGKLQADAPVEGYYYWQNNGLKGEPASEYDNFPDLPFSVGRQATPKGTIYDSKRGALGVDKELDRETMLRYRQMQKDGYRFVPGQPPPMLLPIGKREILSPTNPAHVAAMQEAEAKYGSNVQACLRELRARGYDYIPPRRR